MWPNSDETQTLLKAAREGDSSAVNGLLERHRDALCRMVSFRLDRGIAARLDASDVVQDTLIEAHRRLEDYLRSPDMPFHLWLRHIARDRLIDAHRRHRGAERRSVDREEAIDRGALGSCSSIQLLGQLAAAGLTPASLAIRAELEHRFAEAVDHMDEDDREIILLRHFEQLSNQEAAQVLGVSDAAASMRYLRAVRRLRERLGDADRDGSAP